MRKTAVFLLLGLVLGVCQAELPGVRHWTLEADLEATYKNVYRSLENNNMFVIFEANMGRTLAGFSGRWGANYNRNQLQGIRSMMFCRVILIRKCWRSVPCISRFTGKTISPTSFF